MQCPSWQPASAVMICGGIAGIHYIPEVWPQELWIHLTSAVFTQHHFCQLSADPDSKLNTHSRKCRLHTSERVRSCSLACGWQQCCCDMINILDEIPDDVMWSSRAIFGKSTKVPHFKNIVGESHFICPEVQKAQFVTLYKFLLVLRTCN